MGSWAESKASGNITVKSKPDIALSIRHKPEANGLLLGCVVWRVAVLSSPTLTPHEERCLKHRRAFLRCLAGWLGDLRKAGKS